MIQGPGKRKNVCYRVIHRGYSLMSCPGLKANYKNKHIHLLLNLIQTSYTQLIRVQIYNKTLKKQFLSFEFLNHTKNLKKPINYYLYDLSDF